MTIEPFAYECAFLYRGQRFILSPLRGLYWENERALMISDLHIGKAAHFRKAGLAIPPQIVHHDIDRLTKLITRFQPSSLLVLGDLFHSSANHENVLFQNWREKHPQLPIHLIMGNHDRLTDIHYSSLSLTLHRSTYEIGECLMVHDKADLKDSVTNSKMVFCGHLHPVISIPGAGRAGSRLPCFHFGNNFCVLPAFGHFTGGALVKAGKHDTLFVVLPNGEGKVMELKGF